MKETMGLQLELEKSLNSPAAIFFIMPIMKHFPSKLMGNFRRLAAAFDKFLDDCLSSHMETYNPG